MKHDATWFSKPDFVMLYIQCVDEDNLSVWKG